MGEATSNSILVRKAAAGREDHLAKAMTAQKALRLTVAKVSDELLELPMAAIGLTSDTVLGETLNDVVDGERLLILMDGPMGRTGLAILDSSLTGGLVQQQTMGRVLEDKGEPRKMTRTDAALAGPLIDDLIARSVEIMEKPADAKLMRGYKYGAMAEEKRTALMELEAYEYLIHKITLDLSKGARQGELWLFFPIPDEDEIVFPSDDPAEELPDPDAPDLTKSVLSLKAELNMVLFRLKIPIKNLQGLAPGQVLALPPNSFPAVQITGVDGTVLRHGVLGMLDGQRAVRPDPRVPHAQPMRRDSDRENLDLPDVEMHGQGLDIPGSAPMGSPNLPALPTPGAMPDFPGADGLPDLPTLDDTGIAEMMDPPGNDILPVPEPPDLPEVLPELDDLPDLADLPDLTELANLPDIKSA